MVEPKMTPSALVLLIEAKNYKSQGKINKAVFSIIQSINTIRDPSINLLYPRRMRMIEKLMREFLQQDAICSIYFQATNEQLSTTFTRIKSRHTKTLELIAEKAGTCLFCKKRAVGPGKFIGIHRHIWEEPSRKYKKHKEVISNVERIPCCRVCANVITGLEWFKLSLIFSIGIFVAIQGFLDKREILFTFVAFGLGTGLGFIMSTPIINLLIWVLYTNKVGEPFMNRMRMIKPETNL